MPLKLCDRCWRLFITDRSFHPRLTLPRPLCTITTQTGTAETQTWRRRQRDSGGGGRTNRRQLSQHGGGRDTAASDSSNAAGVGPRPRAPPPSAPLPALHRAPASRGGTGGACASALGTPNSPCPRPGRLLRLQDGPGPRLRTPWCHCTAPRPAPGPCAPRRGGIRVQEDPGASQGASSPPPSPGGKMAPGAGRRAGAAAPGGTAGPGAPPTAPALPFAARPADSGCGGGRISFQPARPRAESWRPPRRVWRGSFLPHAQAPPHKPTRTHAKSGWQETPQGRD